ncbi:MAG: hypothetical protein HY958_14620 [Bacteroidia bacterium]|nr:hypothetical protein [Bacteroidia bacterium]
MKYILLIFFLFLIKSSLSQIITFNKIYYDTLPAVSRNVVETDSGYVILGGGGWDSVYVFIMAFDHYGNQKWIKKVGKNNQDWFHGINNSLIKSAKF